MTTHPEGERLAAAAYATPPISPTGLGPAVNGLIYFFIVFTAIIVGLRAYVRFDRSVPRLLWGWGWDDVLAISGYVASIPSAVFGVMSTYYGLGGRGISQLLQIRALEYFMYYELLYFAASTATKISITLTVVRLCGRMKLYRWIAIGNAVLMLTAAGATGAYLLANCRPMAVYWNPDLGECTYGVKGLPSLPVVSIIGSVFQMLTDVISATLPFFLISSLQMPKQTKVALICVLGLGLLASAAAFSRILFYKYWDTGKYPDTLLHYTGVIVITSELELGLGILACNIPPLRRLIKSLYLSIQEATSGAASGGRATAPTKGEGGGTQLSVLASKSRAEGSNWARLDDDKNSTGGSSQKPIIFQQTTIAVETSKVDGDSIDDHSWRRV